MGWSPGLVVMGGDSCSEGSNPNTVYWIDIFSHKIVVKVELIAEKTKINENEAGEGPFLKRSFIEKGCFV